MRVRNLIRYPLFIIICVGALWLFAPIRYSIQTRYWEYKIKQGQNPLELQSWATNLIAIYGPSNITARGMLIVTNTPPLGMPGTAYGARVVLEDWGGGHHVKIIWGGSFLPQWGLMIGDTNFISGQKDKWKPGIYFFRSP